MASLTGQYSVHFLAFPLGVALATYEHKIIGFFDENMHKLLLIICTISSLISFLIYHYSGAYSYVFTLSSAVVVILLGIFLQKKSIISRYLDLFGRYSYEIYLVELQVLWYLKVSSFIKYPPLVNLFILIECLVIAIVVNKIIKFLMKFNKGFKGKVSSN